MRIFLECLSRRFLEPWHGESLRCEIAGYWARVYICYRSPSSERRVSCIAFVEEPADYAHRFRDVISCSRLPSWSTRWRLVRQPGGIQVDAGDSTKVSEWRSRT